LRELFNFKKKAENSPEFCGLSTSGKAQGRNGPAIGLSITFVLREKFMEMIP